jgi:hypothetical protein
MERKETSEEVTKEFPVAGKTETWPKNDAGNTEEETKTTTDHKTGNTVDCTGNIVEKKD